MEKEAKIYVAGHRGMVGSAIARALEKNGYRNIITRRSKELDLRRQEAVERFRTSTPGELAAILMDIRMPVMNGLDAAKAIRAMDRPDAGTVPIIAMTANAYEDDREKTRAAGMNEHITKPIEPQRLFQALEKHISKRKRSKQKEALS